MLQPMIANNAPPGAELPASRRQECLPEAHGWTGRKKQRTADTLDLQKAALSNACEQPAAILGMVPCPPDASILPLVCISTLNLAMRKMLGLAYSWPYVDAAALRIALEGVGRHLA